MRRPCHLLHKPILVFLIVSISELVSLASAASNQGLKCSPGTLWFGDVATGTSKVLSATLVNNSAVSVTVYAVSQTVATFSLSGLSFPLTLAPSQQAGFQITFTPQAAGHVDGSFSFTNSVSSTATNFAVHATGVAKGTVSVEPGSLSFGSLAMGASATLPAVLTNSGTTGLSISQISVTGAGFNLAQVALPLHLAVGQSVSLNVSFTPSLPGLASGTLSISSNASNPSLTVLLSGSGASPGVLGASFSSLSFGSVQTGNSSQQAETLTNSGGSSLAISQATVTGAGFSVSGLNLPLSLVPGQSFTFGVTFAPSSTGAASGTIAVTSSATNSSLDIALSGNGTAAPAQHSVSLVWNPSGSSVAGYNVYRGTQPGGPYAKLNSSPSSNTAYSDISVQTGQTYFYVTTAVANSGMESGYSNQVQATIPGAAGGVPGVLAATSNNLSFGSVQVGSSQALPETFTNSGGSTVTISQASASGNGFSTSGVTLPLTLTPGQSVTLNTVFAPSAPGNAAGALAVVSDASDSTLAIPLIGSGIAVGSLAVAPSTLAFGSVAVGQSKVLGAALTATGSSVTISSATTNTTEFIVGGVSLPIVLAAGQSAPLTVTFTPQVSGAASDSLSFLSNASGSPVSEALSGTGTAVSHSVVLSWVDASSAVAGYNIYRAGTSGGPYSKINSTLNAMTTYTDSSVQAGQTYFYVVTAVDESGRESSDSSPVQALIPVP